MKRQDYALADWSVEEVEQGKAWVRAWQLAGVNLERVHRDELRALDAYQAIERLSGSTGGLVVERSGSGLIEQQRWFMKAAGHRGRN